MMKAIGTWWDGMGDRNPQLWRELQGRWRWPSILLHLGASLVLQLSVVYGLYTQLPGVVSSSQLNRYGTGLADVKNFFQVLTDSTGHLIINWPLWWLDVFTNLSVLSIVLLIPTSIALLLLNLNQEEQRGTLELVRLSPQRPQEFLNGKLWGVPSLVYLGLFAAVPLHLWAAVQAGINLFFVLTWYAVVCCTGLMLGRLGLLLNYLFRWSAGFQNFVIPAAIFLFLLSTPAGFGAPFHLMGFAIQWAYLFSPLATLPSIMPATLLTSQKLLDLDMTTILDYQSQIHWFIWPIGTNGWSLSVFVATFSLIASVVF